MSIDRDDKFEGHEESEYHFSDEEVSYEVDAETPKAAPAAGGGEQKESIISRLTHSKRMLISLGVFLVLVFVAYKMVGSGTSIPATDITAAPAVVSSQPTNMPGSQAAAQPARVAAAPTTGQPAPSAMQAAPTAPAIAGGPTGVQAVPAVAGMPAVAPVNQPAVPVVQQPAGVVPATGVQTNPGAILNNAAQMAQQLIQQTQANIQQQVVQHPAVTIQANQNPPAVATLPAVIPVQSTIPTTNTTNLPIAAPSVMSTMGGDMDAKTAALTAISQKAMEQLQGQYSQQFNNVNNQNKAIQDQIQNLNSRVADMESKLNQLVQVLTRQHSGMTPSSSMANPPPTPQPLRAPDVKIAYNVQAIIPGRAWLKSDSGETLTVAEGDMIRDVGRVTKIDPYDGVVEINTGTRAVSLSYGNGG